MLDNYRQFIAWHFVNRPGEPKPAKIPFDPATGFPIDPHNPAHWRSRAEIEATGQRAGFVLSTTDPFFFFDLDDCWNAETRTWHPEAAHIASVLFPGFATEVSISGTGLHIMGTCNKAMLANRRHKFTTPGRAPKKWLEFYTDKRFVALGQGFQGRFDLDGTAMLSQIVPQGDPAEDVELSNGPVHGYTGPTDDEELIRRMLGAGGSINQQMGGKARIVDLWTGDASILCQMFPSATGDAYDRSSADAALMMHLAFWTGKDAARMDRLFRRSGLMRAKYAERPAYQRSTLQRAISGQQRIYDVVQAATKPGAPTEAVQQEEFLLLDDMKNYFQGCVYVRDHHAIMTPDGALVKPEAFAADYGGHLFQMSSDMTASGLTKNAFEAFTQCRIHKFPRVRGVRFQPKEEPGSIKGDTINTYVPAVIETEEGDITPFFNHLALMLPNETDRTIFLTWMVALVQNPGVKFQWAPVLQGTQGNGTSWLAKILTYAIGEKFCHKPNPEDITNKFNSWMYGKLFIDVQEIMLEGKYELVEAMKDWLTDDRIQLQAKGRDQTMMDNFANWLLVTNHKNAIPLTANDRRFAPLFTAHQSLADLARDGLVGTQYFPKLWDWSRDVGFKRIAHWLRTAAIPDERYNPATVLKDRAPQTSSTAEAIASTIGAAEQYLMECVASGDAGFRNGWISSYMAEKTLSVKRINVTPQRLAKIMDNLRYMKVDRSPLNLMDEEGKRPVMYIRADLYRPGLTVSDYMASQGYTVVPLRVVK